MALRAEELEVAMRVTEFGSFDPQQSAAASMHDLLLIRVPPYANVSDVDRNNIRWLHRQPSQERP